MAHAPVTSLEELRTLNQEDILDGYMLTRPGDPEPGGNHSRGYHHGWRVRMMDLGKLPITPEHRELARQVVAESKKAST